MRKLPALSDNQVRVLAALIRLEGGGSAIEILRVSGLRSRRQKAAYNRIHDALRRLIRRDMVSRVKPAHYRLNPAGIDELMRLKALHSRRLETLTKETNNGAEAG